MNTNFEKALNDGFLEPVKLTNGDHFEIDGVKYYHPTESGTKMAIARFHHALDILRMHEELKISYEQNKAGWDRVNILATRIMEMTDKDQINDACIEMITTRNRIETRMQFGKDIEQVYQIAAIYLIHENEDPTALNHKIHNDKILSFKGQPDLYAFFLALPLNLSLHLSTALDAITLNYLKELNYQEILDMKHFLLNSKLYGHANEQTKFITSRMETLVESGYLLNSLLKNTTTPLVPS